MMNPFPKPTIVVTLGDPAGVGAEVTLIPILGTTVDHGMAFDIAGRNMASEGKMVAAMNMAATMAPTSYREL